MNDRWFVVSTALVLGGTVLVLFVWLDHPPETPHRTGPYPDTFEVQVMDPGNQQSSVQGLGYLGAAHSDASRVGVRVNKTQSGTRPIQFSFNQTIRVIDRDGTVRQQIPVNGFGEDAYVRNTLPVESGYYALLHSGHGVIRLDESGDTVRSRMDLRAANTMMKTTGGLVVATLDSRRVSIDQEKRPIRDARFVRLDPSTGETRQSWSLHELFRDSPYEEFLYTAYDRGQPYPDGRDLFHANSLQLIDRSVGRAHPQLEAGEWLVSLRFPSAIVSVDHEQQTVTHVMHGRTHLQHSATAHPDGTISVFNNLEGDRTSAVDVFNPFEGTTTQFDEFGGKSFYSGCCGKVQKTSRGWLITLTEQARILEINEKGEVLWDYVLPEVRSDQPPAVFQARTRKNGNNL